MGENKTVMDGMHELKNKDLKEYDYPNRFIGFEECPSVVVYLRSIPADAPEQLKAKDKGLALLQRSLSDSLLNAQELERGLAAKDVEIAELTTAEATADALTERQMQLRMGDNEARSKQVGHLVELLAEAEADRDEALKRTVAGLSHDVLTTYGAPNGHGLTLLGRIEALADKCDRTKEGA